MINNIRFDRIQMAFKTPIQSNPDLFTEHWISKITRNTNSDTILSFLPRTVAGSHIIEELQNSYIFPPLDMLITE